jgi:hypothetical protein
MKKGYYKARTVSYEWVTCQKWRSCTQSHASVSGWRIHGSWTGPPGGARSARPMRMPVRLSPYPEMSIDRISLVVENATGTAEQRYFSH